MASSAPSGSPCPVRMITSGEFGACLMAGSASSPFPSGRRTSRKTTSNSVSRSFSSPSARVDAPSLSSRIRETRLRMVSQTSRSSSITKILAMLYNSASMLDFSARLYRFGIQNPAQGPGNDPLVVRFDDHSFDVFDSLGHIHGLFSSGDQNNGHAGVHPPYCFGKIKSVEIRHVV